MGNCLKWFWHGTLLRRLSGMFDPVYVQYAAPNHNNKITVSLFFLFVPVTLRILNVPARNGPKHIYTLYITRILARTRKRKHTHNFIDINLIPGMFNFRDLVDIHVLRCARYIKTCIKHGLDAQYTFHNFPLLFSLKLFTVYRLAAFTVY